MPSLRMLLWWWCQTVAKAGEMSVCFLPNDNSFIIRRLHITSTRQAWMIYRKHPSSQVTERLKGWRMNSKISSKNKNSKIKSTKSIQKVMNSQIRSRNKSLETKSTKSIKKKQAQKTFVEATASDPETFLLKTLLIEVTTRNWILLSMSFQLLILEMWLGRQTSHMLKLW